MLNQLTYTMPLLPLVAIGLLGGCQTAPETSPRAERATAQAFLANFRPHINHEYEGRVVEAHMEENPFEGQRLIMRVEEVTDDGARIAFDVGEDQSRTWVLTIDEPTGRLHLRHDHRYPDGTPHDLTDYGGYAAPGGTANRQSFPADDATAAMLPQAATNVWTMEIDGEQFIYDLRRHDRPRFRASFDLTDR